MSTHDHPHTEGHDGTSGQARNRRPLWVALGITASFLVVEVVGALISGSLALLADAGHMLSDMGALALALFAFWIAARRATPERTYGYLRVEVLAALANAVTLILITLYIFWEAYQRLAEPPPVQSLPMLIVAVAALAANGASAIILRRGAGENLNLRAAFLHVVGDMLGSVGTIIAGLIILTTGWLYADPLVSVLIGLLILYSSWDILREAVDVVLEATPPGIDVHEIEQELRAMPGVVGIHDLHVWTVTSGLLAMSGHLTLHGAHNGQVLTAATQLLRERFGIGHVTLQLEEPAEETQIHHGCYFGPGMTTCAVVPIGHPSTRIGHRH